MSTEENNAQMTEAVGQVIGEVLGAFAHVIALLREQPGFDNLIFEAGLKKLTDREDVTTLQKHAFELLKKSPAQS